jgi:hypothetical protein
MDEIQKSSNSRYHLCFKSLSLVPRREHHSLVTVLRSLPSKGSSLQSQHWETAVLWLLILRSLPTNGTLYHSIIDMSHLWLPKGARAFLYHLNYLCNLSSRQSLRAPSRPSKMSISHCPKHIRWYARIWSSPISIPNIPYCLLSLPLWSQGFLHTLELWFTRHKKNSMVWVRERWYSN